MVAEEIVLPELRLFVREVNAKHINAEFLARCGGKLEEVYIFDPTRHVHCAEITPSYEMRFLYHVAGAYPDNETEEGQAAYEALGDELAEIDAAEELFRYFHVRSVNLDKCRVLTTVTAEEWAELEEEHGDEAWEKWFESRAEYYNCNHPC